MHLQLARVHAAQVALSRREGRRRGSVPCIPLAEREAYMTSRSETTPLAVAVLPRELIPPIDALIGGKKEDDIRAGGLIAIVGEHEMVVGKTAAGGGPTGNGAV